MRSLDRIFAMQEANAAPFWRLKAQEGRQWISCGNHLGKGEDGEGSKNKGDNALELKASQQKLASVVDLYDEGGNTVFSIELLATPSSHGAGMLGPFQFTSGGDEPAQRGGREPDRSQGGFGGLAGMLPGGFQDLLAIDRHHGTIQMQTQALEDRKSTRLNSSHIQKSRMPSSA